MELPERLKSLRKEYGYTAKDLAKILSCSTNLIYEWEHGRCEPSYSTLALISSTFGVSVGYLLGLEDDFGNVVIKKEPTVPGGLSEKETRLLELFNSVSLFAQDGILYQLEALADKNKIKI